jgi:hypothetical protein
VYLKDIFESFFILNLPPPSEKEKGRKKEGKKEGREGKKERKGGGGRLERRMERRKKKERKEGRAKKEVCFPVVFKDTFGDHLPHLGLMADS